MPGWHDIGIDSLNNMPLPEFLRKLRTVTLEEVQNVQGFMQLLMKPRNGLPWSQADKQALLIRLRQMGKTLPYLVLFTIPGGTLMLPLLALFLDRRKRRQQKTPISGSSNSMTPQPPNPIQEPVGTEKE